MAASEVTTLLASLPLRTALLTDQEGAVLLRTAPAAAEELDLQRMAATFAQTAEHAGKLGMGKSRHATAFYGARDDRIVLPACSCDAAARNISMPSRATARLARDSLTA